MILIWFDQHWIWFDYVSVDDKDVDVDEEVCLWFIQIINMRIE